MLYEAGQHALVGWLTIAYVHETKPVQGQASQIGVHLDRKTKDRGRSADRSATLTANYGTGKFHKRGR
jgi:hypothetical protein